MISRFRREVDENCALLGYYTASGGNFPTDVSGTAYQFHLQVSRIQNLRSRAKERSSHAFDGF